MARPNIISISARREPGPGHRLSERTYLDANGHATTDRTQGVTLLGPAGRVIPVAAARLAGLTKSEQPKPDKAEAPEADKADEPKAAPKRRARTSDKSRKPAGDK